MSRTAIEVENLSKLYYLGELHQGTNSFRDRVTSFFKRDGGSKKAESIWALKDVSFEVKEGEVLGVIGRNGAGKSTLLKILSRITRPTKGNAWINGRVGSLLEVGTGFHSELTGRENVFLNGAILGMRKDEIKKKFDEIVAFAGTEKFLDTPVKRYSSGMKVRLGFSVAAHLEPEILLVDEVLAVGDAAFKRKCLGKMGDLSKLGRTILFVSHNLSAIRDLCPQTIRLEEGRILRNGPAHEVIEEYLAENMLEKEHVTLPPDSSKPMCLRSIEILNSRGEPSADVNTNEPFRVRVEYDVNQSVESANLVCFFCTAEGTVVFSSGDADCTPQRFGKRRVGSYIAEFEVPAFLLGEARYTITVNLAVPSEKRFDRHESVISFNVFEKKSSAVPRFKKPRPGILGLKFPWLYLSEEPVLNENDKG